MACALAFGNGYYGYTSGPTRLPRICKRNNTTPTRPIKHSASFISNPPVESLSESQELLDYDAVESSAPF